MNPFWKGEFWRIIAIIALAVIVGMLVGQPFAALALALGAYLCLYVTQTVKLWRWLSDRAGSALPAPQSSGLWREIFRQLRNDDRLQKKLSETISRELQEYRQAAKALPEGAVTLNQNGEIEFINQAAFRLLGLKDPEDVGRPVTNLIRDPKFVRYMEAGDFNVPLEAVSPCNESVTLLIALVPYGNSGKQLLLARDISRLNRLEQIRRDFVANVSHEMKSPLTVIKGYVETLIDDSVSGEHWKKPLRQIDMQTDRMCAIVDELLSLSNLESAPAPESLKPVDVPALIASVRREALELSEQRHEISQNIEDPVSVLGIFPELYSAFSNIVFNAVRYTQDRGRIDLKWFLDKDGNACFSVADNGPGIAPEHIPRLTERFYRVDLARSRELGGTGLGLSITKHVLLRHRATLKIQSELNAGSVFTCVFPPDSVVVTSSAA